MLQQKEELRKDAKKFRKEFIEKVYSKSPEDITDMELWIIHFWIKHYQGEII